MYEIPVEPKPEVMHYSKGVQTAEVWKRRGAGEDADASASSADEWDGQVSPSRKRKRQSRREEEVRARLRTEIEEELKALQLGGANAGEVDSTEKERFPIRELNAEELQAVTTSNDFLDFVERSSKVIERALDEEYDVLADYAFGGAADEDDEDEYVGRKGRRIREVCTFSDETLTKRRMVSDIDFSAKVRSCLRLLSHLSFSR